MDPFEERAQDVFSRVARTLGEQGTRIPAATYRLQLNREFTFAQAIELVDYFADLGVSEIYASPFFRARPESMHGYDIVDHNAFNPAIGTREELDELALRAARRGMRIMLDFVPNHMGIASGINAWWNDVLENGPSSRYSSYFDVTWQPLKRQLEGKVLLPFLGDHYGRVLERGELRVRYDAGAFLLAYYEHTLPLNPRTYGVVLEPMLPRLVEELGGESDQVLELQSIITGLDHLPPRTETKRSKVVERNREKEILKRRLATLVGETPVVARELEASVARVNGRAGEPRSFDVLDALLEQQAYRLSYWRVAAEEINYRRFFDVNELAAIRMENPAVFDATHRLLFELLASGALGSVRIDHPDGLWDPPRYFADLQRGYFLARCRRELEGAPDARAVMDRIAGLYDRALLEEQRILIGARPPGVPSFERPLYIVVEKILSRGESLPARWPVHGTSGYEFAALVGGVLVDGAAEAAITDVYQRFTDQRTPFPRLAYEKKRLILQTALASELSMLAHRLHEIAQRSRYSRDFTLGTLTDVLRETIASFPVYRTYVSTTTESIDAADRAVIDRAVRLGKRRAPTIDPSAFDFLRALLTLEPGTDGTLEDRAVARDFVMRVQQLTGPVVAKGLEDTTFYVYNRLVALNEVGGEPERFGRSVEELHAANAERRARWPASLLATSTHDTKRSEDVRARISVLSELPAEWEAALSEYAAATAFLKTDIDGELAPDRNEEYLLYQTLLGTWPFEEAPPTGPALAAYTERIVAYMTKATKEAKVNTSWTNSNADYDAAVERFVRGALAEGSALVERIGPLARRCAFHGRFGALTQALLKLTSPGVPDIYQGCELWDLSLVDPDNRRPVDYARRRALLDELRRPGGASPRELLEHAGDGRVKLWVTHQALQLRRERPELFGGAGEYVPLAAVGPRAAHVVAFARRAEGRESVVVAARLTARLVGGRDVAPVGDVWAETLLPVAAPRYRDRLTGAVVEAVPHEGGFALPLERALAELPVALHETFT